MGNAKEERGILIKGASFNWLRRGNFSLRVLTYSRDVSYIVTLFHLVPRVSCFNCTRERENERKREWVSPESAGRSFVIPVGGKTARIYANTRAVWCTLCAWSMSHVHLHIHQPSWLQMYCLACPAVPRTDLSSYFFVCSFFFSLTSIASALCSRKERERESPYHQPYKCRFFITGRNTALNPRFVDPWPCTLNSPRTRDYL